MHFAARSIRPFYLAPFLRQAVALFVGCLLTGAASGVTLYWDRNGNTAGAGATPTGTWSTSGGTNKNWSTNSAGTATTATWTSGADAVFSAGSDATGNYTVTVSGTQNVSSITVQEGSPTLATGTINFSDASPDILVASGSTLTFGTALTSSNNSLNLGSSTFTGTTVFSADTSLSGTVTLAGGTLSLASASYSFGTLNLTGNSTIDFAGSTTLNLTTLNLNGFTLNITNWTAASDFFFATNWTGATYDTMGSSPMNLITFNGFSANQSGWDSLDNQIRPNVPEPATYGALLIGSMIGLLAWRRRRISPLPCRAPDRTNVPPDPQRRLDRQPDTLRHGHQGQAGLPLRLFRQQGHVDEPAPHSFLPAQRVHQSVESVIADIGSRRL